MPEEIQPKKLGKLEVKHDRRNLMAAHYMAATYPPEYDFMKGRRDIPARTFGNTSYGCCTLASQANALARFERLEQRRTILIPDQTVISNYLEMTGGADEGWYELDAIKRWRTIGFPASATRRYTIDGFAQITPQSIDQMKAALWNFKVIKVCFGLPASWSTIDPPTYAVDGVGGVWDVGDDSPTFGFGSWGFHSMMADGYNSEGIWIGHTWYHGTKTARQFVTWAAVVKYADEAYSIVDSFNAWRSKKPVFNLEALAKDVARVTAD